MTFRSIRISRSNSGGGRRSPAVCGFFCCLSASALFFAITSSCSIYVVESFQSIASISTTRQQTERRVLTKSSSSYTTQSTTSINAVSQQQSFILDGGEFQSFLLHNNNNNNENNNIDRSKKVGCLSLATGTDDSSRRIIGVVKSPSDDTNSYYETISLLSNNIDIEVYTHTIAQIPQSISDKEALSTAAAALVGIHCAIPKVDSVGGGGNDEIFYSGKAVVLGGNEYASFIADGLATLGIDVSLVSTGGTKTKNKQVKVMQPAVAVDSEGDEDEDDEVGFATAVGQFDSLIDTISNERKGMVISIDDDNPGAGSGVLQLLRSQHECDKYISTLTQSQQIIKNEGVLFGPGKANAHVKSMESISSTKKCMNIIPSSGFGPSTLQVLLENNILFSSSKNANKAVAVRGWELKDFWEETSWPRDSSGTGVRYGLPVVEEKDDDEDLKELLRMEQLQRRTRLGTEGGMDDKEVQKQSKVDERNPFVTQIVGVDGLADNIISKQRDSVVFVAMRSCRTCKGINPMFTKMARDRNDGDLLFAKADASGDVGKALGKQLGVVAVPAFVLFRNGVRYGVVSTSKVPSDRLDKAISDLEAGEDFDTSLEEEDDED